MLLFNDRKKIAAAGRPMFGIYYLLIIMTLVVGYWFSAIPAAAQQAQQEEFLPLIEKWLGDFDGMAERRENRR